jgi:hypothetical protein
VGTLFNVTTPSCLRFCGAEYRLALQVGQGRLLLSADEVAQLLSQQYHNRGKVTAAQLKDRWVSSSWFILTKLYPALAEIGVSAGKTGTTYSVGQPLVVDRDLQDVAVQNPDGSQPRYLVLDGQNRVVKLRREAPYQLYPAYVGIDILETVERATRLLASRLKPHVLYYRDAQYRRVG